MFDKRADKRTIQSSRSGMGQQDGSAKKVYAVHPGSLCFIPQNPWKGSQRGLTPLSCLLTSRCVLRRTWPVTHTETLKYTNQ